MQRQRALLFSMRSYLITAGVGVLFSGACFVVGYKAYREITKADLGNTIEYQNVNTADEKIELLEIGLLELHSELELCNIDSNFNAEQLRIHTESRGDHNRSTNDIIDTLERRLNISNLTLNELRQELQYKDQLIKELRNNATTTSPGS